MVDRYLVIDTNVFVSAMLFPLSKANRAMEKAALMGSIVLSQPIVYELSSTLSENKFDRYLSLTARLLFLEDIFAQAKIMDSGVEIKVCRDPNDDMFLELAVTAQAACIITGDPDLLTLHPFRGIPILSPAAFLNWTLSK